MGRQPLQVGTWGLIRTMKAPRKSGRDAVVARAAFRDFDGVTRTVEAWGRTATIATQNLRHKLQNRVQDHAVGSVTGMTRFREASEIWLARIDEQVKDGLRSPGTAQTYRGHLSNHLDKALGELRLAELTTPVIDRVIREIKRKTSTATAKSCRSVISGVLGMAVREGAIAHNPTRETSRLESPRGRQPRSLTPEERVDLMEHLRSHELALRHDLPDLVFFMLATGVRIGEALALEWREVDLDKGQIEITSTLIRVKDEGLLRKTAKSRAGERLIPLPASLVSMLRRRFHAGARLDHPVFPDTILGFRDPTNVRRSLRSALRGTEYEWVTSHTFRKTAATVLDQASLSARAVADQLGHSRPSMTQDVYFGRRLNESRVAEVLDDAFRELGA